MLSRLSAAVVGLLAFAGCIVVGLLADNPTSTILLRALGGLTGGMAVGYLCGVIAQVVVNEQFRSMVAADVDAEMTEAEQKKVAKGAAAESTTTGGPPAPVGKADTEDSREEVHAPSEEATLAARAAKQLIPDAD